MKATLCLPFVSFTLMVNNQQSSLRENVYPVKTQPVSQAVSLTGSIMNFNPEPMLSFFLLGLPIYRKARCCTLLLPYRRLAPALVCWDLLNRPNSRERKERSQLT